MKNFQHEHILSLLGVCLDNDPQFIIMELMEGGDLLSFLRGCRATNVIYSLSVSLTLSLSPSLSFSPSLPLYFSIFPSLALFLPLSLTLSLSLSLSPIET